MSVHLNKNKSIGKVLFIVEGGRTEPYILRKFLQRFSTINWRRFLEKKVIKEYERAYSDIRGGISWIQICFPTL